MKKTRYFRLSRPTEIVRRCRECGEKSKLLPFLVLKDSKNKHYYMHCLCQICYREYASLRRREWYLKNREREIAKSALWNDTHRAHYNLRRRKNAERKRMETINEYEEAQKPVEMSFKF